MKEKTGLPELEVGAWGCVQCVVHKEQNVLLCSLVISI